MKPRYVHIPKTGGKMIKQHFPVRLGKASHHPVWGYKFDEDDFIFTMVRNPYDRMVSNYEFLKRGGINRKGRRYRDLLDLEKIDFKQLVERLFNERQFLLKVVLLRPQMFFITDTTMFDYIGRFENFSDEILEIEKRLDYDKKEQEVVNKTPHEHFSTYYNEEIADMVYDMYKCDFKILEYDKDSWRMK